MRRGTARQHPENLAIARMDRLRVLSEHAVDHGNHLSPIMPVCSTPALLPRGARHFTGFRSAIVMAKRGARSNKGGDWAKTLVYPGLTALR